MLSGIRQWFSDAKTINALCTMAEVYANAAGQKEPGAEHFLLAALNLPDGSARRAFERIGIDEQKFSTAIEQQHREALQSIGIDAGQLEREEDVVMPVNKGLYRAQPSGQALMQRLADESKATDRPLSGAHVVRVVAATKHGVAPRALRSMGVDSEHLAAAAQAEIEAMSRA